MSAINPVCLYLSDEGGRVGGIARVEQAFANVVEGEGRKRE